MRGLMRTFLALASLLLVPAVALGQGGSPSTPIAVNLQKVPVGSWADYTLSLNQMTGKVRWALIERTASGVGLEMIMEGGPAQMMGQQKVTTKMVLAPDVLTAAKPIKQLIMQVGDQDPMELPPDAPQMQGQKFEKPDPKKLVGKETLKVPAGSFQTSHYRDVRDQATVDFWVSETLPPLGLVKMTVTPKEQAQAPKVSLELSAKGSDAKPTITKKAQMVNPSAPMGVGKPPAGVAGPKPAKADKPAKAAKPEAK
jgi:hypothetical protein